MVFFMINVLRCMTDLLKIVVCLWIVKINKNKQSNFWLPIIITSVLFSFGVTFMNYQNPTIGLVFENIPIHLVSTTLLTFLISGLTNLIESLRKKENDE